jgi:hypothetical protein
LIIRVSEQSHHSLSS